MKYYSLSSIQKWCSIYEVHYKSMAIDRATIDDVKDLDLAMLMHNLLEYSSNYSCTTVGLWFYSKDEATDFNNAIADTNDFKTVKYKTKLIESTATTGVLENATIVVSSKCLSNFWLEMPWINCKVKSKLKWTKHCVFAADNVDNTNGNQIISSLLSMIQNYVSLLWLYQQKIFRNYQNLAKSLKPQSIGMNIKQKMRIEMQQMSIDIFSN